MTPVMIHIPQVINRAQIINPTPEAVYSKVMCTI